jgi:hypothetical protein
MGVGLTTPHRKKTCYEQFTQASGLTPSIVRIIKSRRMRWAGHVSRMGEKKNAYRLFVGKPEGKSH